MPKIEANGIIINYSLTGPSAGELIVLINGLADDLSSWATQTSAFEAAGYRVLTYDNRGIGKTSRPEGPYTADLLATDLHALLLALEIKQPFHLMGVSMGGMIAQQYALMFPNGSEQAKGSRMLSLALCCTYSEPSAFCGRMFELWADMARRMSVQDVMRDVTLWAFTVPFFRSRGDELKEVEEGMRGLDMDVPEYLAQLNVIQKFDSTSALEGLKGERRVLGNLDEAQKVMVLAGKTDILIPVQLSREIAERVEGSRWVTVKGGHACMWEFPDDFNKTCLEFWGSCKDSSPEKGDLGVSGLKLN